MENWGKDDHKKVAKATAHYRSGTDARHCGVCTMFRFPHSCTAVRGSIDQDYVCDYFDHR